MGVHNTIIKYFLKKVADRHQIVRNPTLYDKYTEVQQKSDGNKSQTALQAVAPKPIERKAITSIPPIIRIKNRF